MLKFLALILLECLECQRSLSEFNWNMKTVQLLTFAVVSPVKVHCCRYCRFKMTLIYKSETKHKYKTTDTTVEAEVDIQRSDNWFVYSMFSSFSWSGGEPSKPFSDIRQWESQMVYLNPILSVWPFLSASAVHTCEDGHFACPSGNCISSVWLCDGQKDCEDGADEFQCGKRHLSTFIN